MKNLVQIYAAALITLTVSFTWASDVSIPNTFTADTTAVASEVNDNFTAVETAINDNDQRITNIESSYVKGRGDLSVALTGTVTISSTTSQLLGTGTSFTSELNVGDSILVGTEIHEVTSITSDTDLTLASTHSAGALDITAFKDGKLLSISTGAGQEKLSVDKSGALTADSFNYGTAKTYYQFYIAGDFRLARGFDTTDWYQTDYSGAYGYPLSNTSLIWMVTGVRLPQGADITEVRCYYSDTIALPDFVTFRFLLHTRGITSSSYTTIGQNNPPTTQAAGIRNISDTNISGTGDPVDNGSYSYYLQFGLSSTGEGGTDNKFYGCRIGYQLTQVSN